jgi:hypothetical protein
MLSLERYLHDRLAHGEAIKRLVASLAEISEKNSKWKLLINEPMDRL